MQILKRVYIKIQREASSITSRCPLRKLVEHYLDTPTDFVIFLLLFHPQILDAYATKKEKKK